MTVVLAVIEPGLLVEPGLAPVGIGGAASPDSVEAAPTVTARIVAMRRRVAH